MITTQKPRPPIRRRGGARRHLAHDSGRGVRRDFRAEREREDDARPAFQRPPHARRRDRVGRRNAGRRRPRGRPDPRRNGVSTPARHLRLRDRRRGRGVRPGEPRAFPRRNRPSRRNVAVRGRNGEPQDARIDTLRAGNASESPSRERWRWNPTISYSTNRSPGWTARPGSRWCPTSKRSRGREPGIIIVTHDLRDVWSLADRTVALRDGEIVVDGPPEETASELARLGIETP